MRLNPKKLLKFAKGYVKNKVDPNKCPQYQRRDAEYNTLGGLDWCDWITGYPKEVEEVFIEKFNRKLFLEYLVELGQIYALCHQKLEKQQRMYEDVMDEIYEIVKSAGKTNVTRPQQIPSVRTRLRR